MVEELFFRDSRLVNENVRTLAFVHVMGRFKHERVGVDVPDNAHGMLERVGSPAFPVFALHILPNGSFYFEDVLGIGDANPPDKALICKKHIGIYPFFYAIP